MTTTKSQAPAPAVTVLHSCRVSIRTTYYGPTNTRGSRIKASAGKGRETSIPYPHDCNSEAAHARAAMALCSKMGWGGALLSGGCEDGGYAFVWLDQPNLVCVKCADIGDAQKLREILKVQQGQEEQTLAGLKAALVRGIVQRATWIGGGF